MRPGAQIRSGSCSFNTSSRGFIPSGPLANKPTTLSSKPGAWFIKSNKVMGLPNASGIRTPLQYVLTSALKSSLPWETNCITDVHTNSLDIDPMRNIVVLASTGFFLSKSAYP